VSSVSIQKKLRDSTFARGDVRIRSSRRLDNKKRISLRLWAALSAEPLPIFDLKVYQRVNLTTTVPSRKTKSKSESKPTEATIRNTGVNVDARDNGRANAASRVSDVSTDDIAYENMSIEEIEKLTKRDERKLKKLAEKNARKQRKKVSEINDIITQIQNVEKKMDDFQNDPTPFLIWNDTMEWEDIAQVKQQATNELKRLKSKLQAQGKKRKAVIGEHQKRRDEIRRVEQKLQHPLARTA
jgi:hypothetical protein